MMTKKQWLEILEELKMIRSTNKFGSGRITYQEGCNSSVMEIDKISTEYMYIRVHNADIQDYVTHENVKDVTPSVMRYRFSMTIKPLNVKEIVFK